MFLWWPHTRTHAHTILSRAFWRLSRGERDRARSNWIGLRETRLIFIFLIVCLCYSGILNPRFSAFWGLSFSFILFFLLDFPLVVWFRELDQDLDWTWQAPMGGRLVKERKAGTGDKHITSLSVHTTTGASSTTMKASTLIQFFSVFTLSTKQLDAKISHLSHRCHWGELDSSIYMHLIHFIDPSVTYSWIYISSVYRRFVVLLWICQCQILSLGTEVFRPWLFECVLFYCLRSERVELTYIIMCQLFFLSVSPPYRTIFRWLDLCSSSGGDTINNFCFSFFFSLYLLHKRCVYIVYMKSFIPDWDRLKHWHLPPQMTVGMKITSPVYY